MIGDELASSDGEDEGLDLQDFIEEDLEVTAKPTFDNERSNQELLDQLNETVRVSLDETRLEKLSRSDLAYFLEHLVVNPMKCHLHNTSIIKRMPDVDDFFAHACDFERDHTGKVKTVELIDPGGRHSVTYNAILKLPIDINGGVAAGVPVSEWNARLYALGVAYHKWHVDFFWPRDAKEKFSDLDKEEQLEILERDVRLCKANKQLKDHISSLFDARDIERAREIALRDSNRNQKAAKAIKMVDPLLADAIGRHALCLREMASVSVFASDAAAQPDRYGFDERDKAIFAKYPYIAPGNIWGLEPRNFKPTRQEPPALMRPGVLSTAMMHAIKENSDPHLFSLMQHTGSQWVTLTVEFERDPREINKDHDARLLAERREAARILISKLARELGIILVIEGAEVHGGTKEKGASEVTQTKFEKNKKRTINQKKRDLKPKGGGSPEQSASEEIDEAEREEMADIEARERAKCEKDADNAREVRLKLLTTRAIDHIRGHRPQDRIANENARANGKKDPKPVDELGQSLELKLEELRRAKIELDIGVPPETKATTAYHLAIMMETIRGMINELRAERDARGSAFPQDKVQRTFLCSPSSLSRSLVLRVCEPKVMTAGEHAVGLLPRVS